MSLPPTLTVEDHYRGDAWEGMSIGPIMEDVNGVPTQLALPCVSCRMHFRTKKGVLGYALSSDPEPGEGTIIIIDPAAYVFSIPRQLLLLDAGSWDFDFETIDASTLPMTWFRGEQKVVGDETYG